MGVTTRLIAAALLAALTSSARAQDYPLGALPIAPTDMINYCVYGGLIYSVGSQICVMKGSPPLYCEQPAAVQGAGTPPRPRATWTTSQPPATINCNNDPITGPTRSYR